MVDGRVAVAILAVVVSVASGTIVDAFVLAASDFIVVFSFEGCA